MTGATPCINLISLEDYLLALKEFNIEIYEKLANVN